MTAQLKNSAAIKKQVLGGYKCSAPGCNDDITIYKGTGESIYCRHHQMMLIENGGLAKSNRPYTFWKKSHCEWCGYDPWKDNRFDRIKDKKIKHQAQRSTLICDHIVSQQTAESMGWSEDQIHGPDNIQTLCQICEKIKSAEAGDWYKLEDTDENS